MSTVIKVENVTKGYRLGQLDRRSFFSDWKKWISGKEELEGDPNAFWALKGVTFDIEAGQIVGILGRNGAGKSTLLKILSMITAPTSGRVRMKGRIASLLEVGTGFHQDYTGRDNVYMNGAILGMSQREVAAKFDEIVAFSGVEQFIDTPVKRYSSGMRVRLAFAVAAHLEAELLMIDEVLAVGDAAFQTKCLGKIGEVAGSGRTVLFVSHNAATIESLCTRGIVLNQGQLSFEGTQSEAIAHYAGLIAPENTLLQDRTDREGTGELRVEEIELRNESGHRTATVRSGENVEFALHFHRTTPRDFPRLILRICITTQHGTPVFTQANWLAGDWFGELPERGTFICQIPKLPLPEGTYRIAYRILGQLRGADALDSLENAAQLHVTAGDFFGTGHSIASNLGTALVEGHWRMEHSR